MLERGEPRDPDAVDRAQHDEAGHEGPMCALCLYSRSMTPAIAWPKPMHMAAMP